MIKNFNQVLDSKELDINSLENYRLEELSKLKEESKKIGLIIGGISLVFLILIIILRLWILFLLIFGAGIVFFGIKNHKKGKILKAIKDGLIKKLVVSASENFDYQPYEKVSQHLFNKSKIIRSYSTYSGEDFFSGKINNIPIQFSEITLVVKSDKKSTTVFRGPFFVVELPQNFVGDTTVVHDYVEKSMGGIGRALQKMNLSRIKYNLIKFDNQLFEDYFAVYTKNEAEARKILSNNLCDLLITEKEKMGKSGKVYFAFNENKFYLGLDNRRDIFPVSVDLPITENSLRNHYNEFVDYINLAITFYSIIEENMNSSDFLTNSIDNTPKNDTPPPPPKDGGYKKVRF